MENADQRLRIIKITEKRGFRVRLHRSKPCNLALHAVCGKETIKMPLLRQPQTECFCPELFMEILAWQAKKDPPPRRYFLRRRRESYIRAMEVFMSVELRGFGTGSSEWMSLKRTELSLTALFIK